jgi:hypothetical protein
MSRQSNQRVTKAAQAHDTPFTLMHAAANRRVKRVQYFCFSSACNNDPSLRPSVESLLDMILLWRIVCYAVLTSVCSLYSAVFTVLSSHDILETTALRLLERTHRGRCSPQILLLYRSTMLPDLASAEGTVRSLPPDFSTRLYRYLASLVSLGAPL